MKKEENDKLLRDIIESNLPTETKVELINKINDKPHIPWFIRYLAIRFGLDYLIDNNIEL